MPFDPDTFMQQTIDSPLATEFKLVPEGEYQMMVDDFDSTAFETIDFTYKKGERAGQAGQMHKFNCPFVVQSEAVKAEMGRDKVVARMQIILDIDPQTGGLATGPDKNVQLGRLFQAAGLNAAGTPVSSLRNAGPFLGRIAHRSIDPNNPERKIAEVTRVAPIR